MLSLNKSYKNRKVSFAIHCKYKYLDSTVQRAEDRGQKFYFCRLPFAVNVKLNLSINCLLGQIFSFFIFVFSLTCYRVFFSVPSGISLVTLLCYLLYVNFVIVYHLALIYCQFFTELLVSHHSSK